MATRRKPLEVKNPYEAELEYLEQKLLQLRDEVSERIRNRADTTRIENFSELTEEIDQAITLQKKHSTCVFSIKK